MLSAKRGDLVIDASTSMRQLIQGAGLSHQIVESKHVIDTVPNHIIISRQSTFAPLMPRVNDAIRALQLNNLH
jgi:hypothetical protein